ncbi:phosphoribosyltransferase family protein [Candidatus Gracilibacteria bacterium]|nr:phosphoribosyltransferase family protein [Candidatus Gracilibacteria bacterium]
MLQQNLGGDLSQYILIPIPMYFWKKSFRGYNQSELLVKHVSKDIGVQAEYGLIRKVKKTKQQSHLSRQERIGNLEESFVVNKKLIDKYKDKTIILIDDVISTGATLNSISTLLKQSGAHRVIGCAFASD